MKVVCIHNKNNRSGISVGNVYYPEPLNGMSDIPNNYIIRNDEGLYVYYNIDQFICYIKWNRSKILKEINESNLYK